MGFATRFFASIAGVYLLTALIFREPMTRYDGRRLSFARFRFLSCTLSQNAPAGKISATANSAFPDRRFGWSSMTRFVIPGEVAYQAVSLCGGWEESLDICFHDEPRSTLRIIRSIAEAQTRPHAKRRVLVPTMGALHKAHGEIIRVAREHAGKDGEVAVSIFVNPLQFEPEAITSVIRARKRRMKNFAGRPESTSVPSRPCGNVCGGSFGVRRRNLAVKYLEGKSRPGHFRGVCTVVAKLFNILSPDAAVFGEKDFQQLAIIRRMVRDLNFKIDIVAVPTVREEDGLAFSSRNQYLNSEERKQAAVLHKALLAAAKAGKKSAREIVDLVRKVIGEAPLARIDYVDLVDAETLQPIESVRPNSLLALAVFFGKTRLIDNIRLP